MNQVLFNNYTEQNELYFGQPVPGIQLVERGGQMVGSKLNCTPGKQEEKKRGRMGREQGNACKHS